MMAYKNFTVDVDGDGIALVTWNMPDRSMNVFSADVMTELGAIVDQVSADAKVKGVVVTSGKDTFSGGADLTMLETMGDTFKQLIKDKGEEAANKTLFEQSSAMSRTYRKLETSGKPWVAAVNGTAMGGAFELALACHHRVVSDNPKLRLGLPEVKVGLFPGAGGTQRVPRIVPTQDALQMLFRGEALKADKAKSMKLIDQIVPQDKLVETAKAWIKAGGKAKQPWDEDGFKLPNGPVYSKTGMMTFPPANAILRRETYDNYPAAKAILQCVYEGLQLPMDLALKVESRWFTHILKTKEAAAMIRSLFISMQELNKGARRPEGVPPSNIKKVAVLGAGFMGAGVAYVTADAGIEVILVDRDQASADKGKAHVASVIDGRIKKGRATAADKEKLLARVKATADYNDIKDVDLVVEAVFEDRKVKAEVIAKVDAVIRADAIFGSNTSTLPITSLADMSKDKKRFVGIHFFSPVEKMMLVEIIKGKETGDKAVAVALDYVRAIKKTPIVVEDSRGFYTSRVVGTYIREGHMMLTEGVPAAMVENVGRMAGMPVGPLSLNDEVAVDLAWKILKATKADLGAAVIDERQEALLEEMVEKRGRYGRKNAKGFYDYPEKGPKKLWPGISEIVGEARPAETYSVEELKQRFLVIQALETARCVEEGVITDVREGDVGSILGFGFAPFTGGTLSYIDFMGVKNFVALCEKLAGKQGPRFAPNALLKEMAAKGETFYSRFAPKKNERAAA
jgi:3-hydroxyacyl-CoA dehydrogenase/enoyl-CoA hydratase/3-hydroxybutyryl-CoA epimerase